MGQLPGSCVAAWLGCSRVDSPRDGSLRRLARGPGRRHSSGRAPTGPRLPVWGLFFLLSVLSLRPPARHLSRGHWVRSTTPPPPRPYRGQCLPPSPESGGKKCLSRSRIPATAFRGRPRASPSETGRSVAIKTHAAASSGDWASPLTDGEGDPSCLCKRFRMETETSLHLNPSPEVN